MTFLEETKNRDPRLDQSIRYWSPLKKITKYVDPEGAISRSDDTYNESFYPWQKTLLFGVDITF